MVLIHSDKQILLNAIFSIRSFMRNRLKGLPFLAHTFIRIALLRAGVLQTISKSAFSAPSQIPKNKPKGCRVIWAY